MYKAIKQSLIYADQSLRLLNVKGKPSLKERFSKRKFLSIGPCWSAIVYLFQFCWIRLKEFGLYS